MKAFDLLKDLTVPSAGDRTIPAVEIVGLTSDSREVKPGYLFVAIRGTAQDGNMFVASAVKAGATLIVGEVPPNPALSVPFIRVDDGRLALAELASAFYGHPSRSLKVIGVTGTSGKTTTTYLLESILRASREEVGVIGTVNYRYREKILPASHTTPGPVELQALLADMLRAGCTAVVMEVSSHALKMRRVSNIAFTGMIFTNLSREHLDYHPDMEDYFASKKLLFTDVAVQSAAAGKQPVGVIHTGERWGVRLFAELSRRKSDDVRIIGCGESNAWTDLKFGIDGVTGKVTGPAGPKSAIEVRSSLAGSFNAENILVAVTLCREIGVHPGSITRGVTGLVSVPGRMERVANPVGIHVLVDYAHKPDALEKVLKTLAALPDRGRLITVFGCGGDRDRSKRPVMGKIASDLSDQVFVTSDNPRTEDPAAIIREIWAGIPATAHARVQTDPDRRGAIYKAIAAARAKDIVVIAGKGHEDYQILGVKKVHFDDREVAREALVARNRTSLG